MRVVIDNGEYWLQNKGDLALLGATVGRLRARWPSARIGVVTFQPTLFRAYEPRAEPLYFTDGGGWPHPSALAGLAARMPARVVGPATRIWRGASAGPRRLARTARDRILPGQTETASPLDEPASSWPPSRPRPHIPAAVETATLVLAMGGGYMADVDRNQAHRTLDLLERAADLGIPTAMMGQGLGPIEDLDLLARARDVLPRVNLIAVREPLHGAHLLTSLGVLSERIALTGDDAVEFAFGFTSKVLGRGLGVCLRIAEYSPVEADVRATIGTTLRAVAGEVTAPLVPMAVSTFRNEDRRTTLPLTDGYSDVFPMLGRYCSASDLVGRVSACRVVVTGAYHVAVFALSQGIPVVCLSSSKYYDHKFEGLAAMFGPGVTTVTLESDDLAPRLSSALLDSWHMAPGLREGLLAAASTQIAANRAVYERLFSLVQTPRFGR